ncbi:hypothetical protein V3C99_011340 [Haemonchus contortus]|uniref:DDE_3 domain-containing protein n=1 Tax=Haemonchus contortus TaxID=6289 RepID=A0A7I5E7Y1_HAECO
MYSEGCYPQRLESAGSDRKECRGSRQEGKSSSTGRIPCPNHGLGRGVCLGKTPLIFVDPGVEIDKDYYLKDAQLSWADSHFNGRPWTFQQDPAPSHKTKVVQSWCKSELPDFISAEEYPASSPDLNLLDYHLWSYLESKACATPHPNLDFLKAALIREWDEIDDALLNPVIDAFPERLSRCRPCQRWPNREETYGC